MKRRSSFLLQRWRWRLLMLGVGFFLLFGCIKFSASSSSLATSTPFITTTNTMPMPATHQRIAFLFLVRNRMPLDALWDLFFKGAQADLFSIYVHARPGYVYDSTNTDSSFFWNRQINDSIQVEWGEASMIDAERILLRKALQDPSVSHFVLLSESCIPLYSFSYIYEYITSSSKSFVDSFVEKKNARYNAGMFPTVTRDKWRKGSQWFVLVRAHAEIVVADDNIIQTFYDHCKRFSQLKQKAPPAQTQRDVLPDSGRKYGVTAVDTRSDSDCVPDEHYIQTLLAIKGVENEIERRTVTYTLWKASDRGRQTDRWHPVTFKFLDVSPQLIRDIQGIHSVKYESEGRTEWCSSNGVPRACYLFARKFTKTAVLRLMRDNETDFFSFAAGNLSVPEKRL